MHVTDPCDLSDNDGKVYYMYNGTKREATTGVDPVGSYYLTAEFNNSSADSANIASINGKHFSFTLTPATSQNIRLINTGATAAVENTNTVTSVTIYAGVSGTTITLYRDSSYSTLLSPTNTLEYAVRANADRNEAWATDEYVAFNSTHAAYAVGALVAKDGIVYVCNTELEENAAWNASNFTELGPVTPTFSDSTDYAVGDSVMYSSTPYVCSTTHSAGAWNANHFTTAKLHKDDKVIVSNGTQSD